MSADPISLITAPARLGLKLAFLPLRVARGLLAGGQDDGDRYVPTAEPSTAGDRAAPKATPAPKPKPRAKPKPKPAAPGPGPEIHVEAPWPDYDDLALSDLLLRIEQATPAEKAVAGLYERQSANREAVLHQVDKP